MTPFRQHIVQTQACIQGQLGDSQVWQVGIKGLLWDKTHPRSGACVPVWTVPSKTAFRLLSNGALLAFMPWQPHLHH